MSVNELKEKSFESGNVKNELFVKRQWLCIVHRHLDEAMNDFQNKQASLD